MIDSAIRPQGASSHLQDGRAGRVPVLPWVFLALAGWLGLAWLAAGLLAASPPRAAFDLQLLLDGGSRVAAGVSPYDASIVAGNAPTAEDLFYSYPPPVAQVFAAFDGLATGVVLLGLALVAVAGLAWVVARAGRAIRPEASGGLLALRAVALAPLAFPFAIALLFGNLDATFPFLYGMLALTTVTASRGVAVGAGVSLALASVKLHPVSLGAWFLARGLRDRLGAHPGAGATPFLVATAAAGTGIGILVLSLIAGGLGPWQDYVAFLRAASSAAIIDPRNIGPASQLAGVLGGSESLGHTLQLGVSLLAVGLTILAAWFRRDAVESLAWAATASLVTLPLTWYHHPAALMPFGAIAWMRASGADGSTPDATRRARRVRLVLLASGVVAGLSIAVLPVTLWIGVALLLVAVHESSGLPLPATADQPHARPSLGAAPSTAASGRG